MALFARLAYRNLFRHGRRNLLTGSSLALGLVGVSLLGAYLLRMERYLAVQSIYLNLNGHVIAYAERGLDRHLSEPAKYSLSPAVQSKLEAFAARDPRVKRSSPVLKVAGLLQTGCGSFPFSGLAAPGATAAWARAEEPVREYLPELSRASRGRGYWELDEAAAPVNYAPRLAEILGKEKTLGEPGAEESTRLYDCARAEDRAALRRDPSLQIVGQAFGGGLALADVSAAGWVSSGMAFQDDTALFLPYSLAQAAYQTESATALTFFLQSEADIAGFVKDLRAYAKDERIAVDVYPFSSEAISAFYVGGMQFNWVMLYLFLALVCGVVAISLSNSLYISLSERKAELGTLLAIGFSRGAILRLLLWEGAFLFAASLGPALLLTYGLRAMVHASGWRFQIPGLAADIPLRLHLPFSFLALVILGLFSLTLLATRAGGARFLRRGVLDLLGGHA